MAENKPSLLLVKMAKYGLGESSSVVRRCFYYTTVYKLTTFQFLT